MKRQSGITGRFRRIRTQRTQDDLAATPTVEILKERIALGRENGQVMFLCLRALMLKWKPPRWLTAPARAEFGWNGIMDASIHVWIPRPRRRQDLPLSVPHAAVVTLVVNGTHQHTHTHIYTYTYIARVSHEFEPRARTTAAGGKGPWRIPDTVILPSSTTQTRSQAGGYEPILRTEFGENHVRPRRRGGRWSFSVGSAPRTREATYLYLRPAPRSSQRPRAAAAARGTGCVRGQLRDHGHYSAQDRVDA